jgi:hypothetical protein
VKRECGQNLQCKAAPEILGDVEEGMMTWRGVRLRPHGVTRLGFCLTSDGKPREGEVVSTVGTSSLLAEGMVSIVCPRFWRVGEGQ